MNSSKKYFILFRYKPGSASSAALVPNASQPADKKKPRSEFVPLREYFVFGAEQLSQKAIARLRELNEKQEAFRLNPEQVEDDFLAMPN